MWLRQTYHVPASLHGYDLTGARIWFHLNANADSPIPEILYFDGRRVAMGDDLDSVVLFEHAKPGDAVTVAMKLMHTVKVKTHSGCDAHDRTAPRTGPILRTCAPNFFGGAKLVPSLAPSDANSPLSKGHRVGRHEGSRAHDQAAFDASLKRRMPGWNH